MFNVILMGILAFVTCGTIGAVILNQVRSFLAVNILAMTVLFYASAIKYLFF